MLSPESKDIINVEVKRLRTLSDSVQKNDGQNDGVSAACNACQSILLAMLSAEDQNGRLDIDVITKVTP